METSGCCGSGPKRTTKRRRWRIISILWVRFSHGRNCSGRRIPRGNHYRFEPTVAADSTVIDFSGGKKTAYRNRFRRARKKKKKRCSTVFIFVFSLFLKNINDPTIRYFRPKNRSQNKRTNSRNAKTRNMIKYTTLKNINLRSLSLIYSVKTVAPTIFCLFSKNGIRIINNFIFYTRYIMRGVRTF